MASRVDDRWLWLGFGVFFVLAAKGIQYAITDTVSLTELDPEQFKPSKEESGLPEDSISIPTLRTLASSPNPSISFAAASLIVSRFVALPDAAEIIANDLYAKSEDTRRRARQAVQYLEEWDAQLSAPLHSTYSDRETLIDSARSAQRDLWDGAWTSRELSQGWGPQGREEGRGGIVSRLDEMAEAGFQPGTAPYAGWDAIPRERPAGATEDEVERRRRRREMVVVHAGDGRVMEEDLIRPSDLGEH